MAVEIIVPSPGESISEVTLSTWLRKEGEWVEMDDPIAEFESDKATFEVNATAAGILAKLVGNPGDTIAVGSVVALLDTEAAKPEGAAAPAKPAATETKKESAPAVTPATPAATTATAVNMDTDVPVAPLAQELLKQYGIPAAKVKGSGTNGRITKMDALEAIVSFGAVNASGNQTRSSGEREERREEDVAHARTIAKRLVSAKNETAMLTTFNEVDMSAIMALRNKYNERYQEKYGIKIGFMSLFAKACSIALMEMPDVNAMIDGDEIVYRNYVDISIAISTPNGLVVPPIRNVESMSIHAFEFAVKDLSGKARNGTLTLEEMTGGTFTITNGGVFGSLMSTPIINEPQSAILGMHAIKERPIAVNGQVEIRPMMYLALSYDHRIIDGRESVGFLFRVKTLLENPSLLVDGKHPAEKVLGL
jgi:2-oxoglutarate dehydrogenase E2 component (dihydrolipoamide succinyltransferase)